LENNPEAWERTILHVHAYPLEPQSIDLFELRDRFGLTNNVRFTFVKPTEDFEDITICNERDKQAMIHQPNFKLNEKEMCRLYNMADCLVISSSGESFCLPVIEAQACGLPCIMGDNSTGPELVGEPEAGLLCNVTQPIVNPLIADIFPVDVEDMAKCMERIYKDDELRKKLSKNALKNAENYKWERIIPIWQGLISDIENNLYVDYGKGDLNV